MTPRKDWTPEQRERYGGGNEVRDSAGCIATLSDGQVVHASGLTKVALRAVADYCDLHGLKISTVSTPRTIAADLVGRNTYYNGIGRRTGINTPEQVLLGRIGRVDLCERPPITDPRAGRQRQRRA